MEKKIKDRPTPTDLEKKKILISDSIEIFYTHHKSEYDRQPHRDSTFRRLTNELKIIIKNEINQYKKDEMIVHPDSTMNTNFHI